MVQALPTDVSYILSAKITDETERQLHDDLNVFGKQFIMKLTKLLDERRNRSKWKIDLI